MQFIGAICEESLKLWLGNSRSLRHPQCQIWQKLSEKRQTFLQVGQIRDVHKKSNKDHS